MSDEDNTQTSEEEVSVETTTEDSQPETETQDSNETSTEDSGEQEGSQATEPASTGDTKPSEETDVKDSQADQNPLSRRSAKYRIQQLVDENKALKQQQKPVQQDDWEETPQEDEQPDIAALVAREVEKRLNPVISESTKTADDGEINELFSGERGAERPKYEPRIRDMWKEPQYKDVAAQDLYKIASFDDAVATATAKAIEDYKQAQKEAKDSSASGSTNTSNRTGKNGKSVADMTDEEFRQHNERVKAGLT